MMGCRATQLVRPVMIAAAVAGGCSSYPLHQNMTNAEIRELVEDEFPAGTPLEHVRTRLAELEVGPRDQRLVERESGPVLTARLWEPGGPWVGRDPYLNWVELDFWFDADRRLRDVALTRRSARSDMLLYTIDPRRNEQVSGREPAEQPPA